jgi:HEAT repeat protein
MSELIWSFKELERFTRWEDAEVRYWAVDRLIRHFPEECCDAIAGFLLDDHDATPTAVARHLGEHGAARHHAILLRGFRLLRGLTPGHCLQALARLGYPSTADLALSALQRGDLTEPALAVIVEALADLGTPAAKEVVREFVHRKEELLAEPAALRGVLAVVDASEIPDVLGRFLKALQWRGAHRAGEGFRTLMDSLQVDDAGWCFRTGPSGRIELRKTIKAVESGYDCDILAAMGEATIKQIAQRFRAGDLGEIVRAIADWTRGATAKIPRDPEDDLPTRIASAVGSFASEPMVDDAERLGHQFQQWVLGFQLSAAIAVARYRNTALDLKRARGHVDRLLKLAEVETAFLLPDLPPAIAVLCRENPQRASRAQEWCLRMLEAQGPFFPKVVALETLGELKAVHFIPEIIEYLSDENSYVYGAAERALGRMGEAIIAPTAARIDAGSVDPDGAQSLLVLLCDLGTRAAHEAVMSRLEWFMEEVGPGSAAEWVSLLGSEDLIDPLRDWLEEDPAMVGQALLLLGSIHNVRIPEEAEILRAIEDERARQAREEPEDDGTPGGPEKEGEDYVM